MAGGKISFVQTQTKQAESAQLASRSHNSLIKRGIMRLTNPKFSFLVVLIATGYSLPTYSQTDDALLASLRKASEVKVALGSAPPYVGVSPSGKAEGYIVDTVNLALKGMGLPELTPVLTAWGSMIPALQARQFAFVGGMNITEARCGAVAFSAPMFAYHNALYVPRGNPKHLAGVASVVQNPDIKLAVNAGSSSEANALKWGVKSEQIVRVADVQAGAATVIGGRVDALLMGQFGIPNPEQKGLEVVVDEKFPIEAIAAAFRKEDIRFRDAFNSQLDVLRSNGQMKELYSGKYAISNWDTIVNLLRASDVTPSCN